MNIRVGHASDQGTRPTQCDASAFHEQPANQWWAAAVMDGYGTDPDVPQAARLAANVAVREGEAGAESALLRAALEVLAMSQDPPEEGWPDPGVVGAVVTSRAGKVTIAWTGDVRVYSIQGQTLVQHTRDHNRAQEARDAGRRVEAADEDVITSSLGRAATHPEEVGIADVPEEVDGFLLASDGLYAAISHERLTAIVTADPDQDPDFVAAALVAAARAAEEAAGPDEAVGDNATALLVRIGAP